MYVRSRERPLRPAAYSHRRQEARYITTIPVTVMRYLRFGPSVTEAMSLDISRSGMSALVCGAPRVGETVVIAPRSRRDAVEILASVRHSTDARTGFQFYPLSSTAEKTIEEWINELEQEEMAQLYGLWRRSQN